MNIIPHIKARLRLLGIDVETRLEIQRFLPVLSASLDHIIDRFYAHMLSFPEGARIFGNATTLGRLKPEQRRHWLRLFSCAFDPEYVAGAIKVGEVHYAQAIPPYLYIAGYNYFHCELIRLASDVLPGRKLPALLAALTRVVSLDMDLALSAYTREYWKALSATQRKGMIVEFVDG